jgi:hydrogenase maturation factor
MGTDAFASAECSLDHCITCSDEGVTMRVVAIDDDRALALCQHEDGKRESVEIALVDAAVGDDLLVHAGVALQRLQEAA